MPPGHFYSAQPRTLVQYYTCVYVYTTCTSLVHVQYIVLVSSLRLHASARGERPPPRAFSRVRFRNLRDRPSARPSARASVAMLTEYERKREARIARNRAILLALVGDLPNALTTTPSPPPRARVKAKEKRARIAIDLEDLRRSDRVRRLPARVYTTFERDEDLGDDAARRRAASDLPKPKPKPKPTRVAAVATASAKAKSPAAPPAKGSIKTLVVRARVRGKSPRRLDRRRHRREESGGDSRARRTASRRAIFKVQRHSGVQKRRVPVRQRRG